MATWAEIQKQQTETFSRKLEDSWAATHEFWKHLVIVEATVLGLTVGLLGGREQAPPLTLVLSWVFLLLAITLGCVLVKVAIDVTIDGAVRGYRGAADIAGIMVRVETGELDTKSDEYQGLFVAATYQSAPNEAARAAFTPKAKELVARYADQLPTSSFLNLPKRSAPERWLHAHWQGLAQTFYWLSLIAFVFLLLTVGPWASRPHAAASPAAATAQGRPPAANASAVKAGRDSSASPPRAQRDSTSAPSTRVVKPDSAKPKPPTKDAKTAQRKSASGAR